MHDTKARVHRSELGSLYAGESEEETQLKTPKAETNAKKNKEKDTESPPDLLKGKIRKTKERTCRESQCSLESMQR